MTRKRLATGVVPAVGVTAYRSRDAVLGQRVAKVLAGALATPVAMEDQPRLFVRVSLEPSHAQRVDDDVSGHVLAQAPADHLTAEQVDHKGQEKQAIVGRDVLDAACPRLVWLPGHSELPIKQVRCDRQLMLAIGGDLEATLALGPDALALHELLHTRIALPSSSFQIHGQP